MLKNILVTAVFLLLISAAVETRAQSTDKKDGEKPAQTIDSWRKALPDSEQTPNDQPFVTTDSTNTVEVKETADQTVQRILDLELQLNDALQKRDAPTLNNLLADDFTSAEFNAAGVQPNKLNFIQSALKSKDIKTYVSAKTAVHVFSSAAITTIRYKKSSSNATTDGDFLATNVWVRRAKIWQLVSHQETRAAKP